MYKKLKILVIDDIVTIRLLLRKTLNQMGFDQVDEAQTGLQAWQMLESSYNKNNSYQFIFSDWAMPEMSGIELLEKVKAHEFYKNIPFVLVTAETEKLQVIKALTMGCSDYIVKPFSANIIRSKILKFQNQFPKN